MKRKPSTTRPPRSREDITKLEDILMFFLYFLTAAALAFLTSGSRTDTSRRL